MAEPLDRTLAGCSEMLLCAVSQMNHLDQKSEMIVSGAKPVHNVRAKEDVDSRYLPFSDEQELRAGGASA